MFSLFKLGRISFLLFIYMMAMYLNLKLTVYLNLYTYIWMNNVVLATCSLKTVVGASSLCLYDLFYKMNV